MDKVSIFVDVQNIYYTVKQFYSRHFDYTKFLYEATNQRKLNKAIAYAIDRGDEKQLNFQQMLKNLGFEIKLKPFIQRSDGSVKGDWDVGITIDVLDYAAVSDVIVLASGDGDFDLLVKKIKSKFDIQVEVYGVQSLTAESLIDSATKFIPIKEDLLLLRMLKRAAKD